MISAAPIMVAEKLQLTAVGVSPESINFRAVTAASEKYITVREQGQGGAGGTLVIIDMANPLSPIRRQISADNALMCVDKKVVALRAAGVPGDNLQVFNLDTRSRLKAHQMPGSVEYGQWISPTILGLVTATSVYHWDMEGNSDAPTKVFNRTPNLAGAQIISYRVSADRKWGLLIGITAGALDRPQLAKGFMQLYSFDQAGSQALEAHAAAFASIKPAGRNANCNVIVFAQRTLKDGHIISRLHLIELGGVPGSTIKRNSELFFPAEFADDFPVSLQISEKYALVYVITKLGLLFVYDLETATPIYRNIFSPDPILLAVNSESTGGFMAINRRGQVILCTVNDAAIVSYVSNQHSNVDLALSLAKRVDLPVTEALARKQFELMLQQGKYKEAAETAANSPQGILRTRDVLERLKAVAPQPGQKQPILVYLGTLLEKGKLNALESKELARLVLSQNKKELLVTWYNEGKLENSEELGDMLSAAGDKDLALRIYQSVNSSGKIIDTLAADYDFIAYTDVAVHVRPARGKDDVSAAGWKSAWLDDMRWPNQDPLGATSTAVGGLSLGSTKTNATGTDSSFISGTSGPAPSSFISGTSGPAPSVQSGLSSTLAGAGSSRSDAKVTSSSHTSSAVPPPSIASPQASWGDYIAADNTAGVASHGYVIDSRASTAPLELFSADAVVDILPAHGKGDMSALGWKPNMPLPKQDSLGASSTAVGGLSLGGSKTRTESSYTSSTSGPSPSVYSGVSSTLTGAGSTRSDAKVTSSSHTSSAAPASSIASPQVSWVEDMSIPWSHIILGGLLGEGGFGKVYKAKWQLNTVAVKVLNVNKASAATIENLHREALIMSGLRHPCIARVFGVVDEDEHHALVMQYYAKGTLAKYMTTSGYDLLELPAKLHLALQVASGMRFMHERPVPVLHGDLKAANILLTGPGRQVVIADFGLSQAMLAGQEAAVASGALTYSISPPEVLNDPLAPRTCAADVYAFAIVLLEIYTGLPTFRGLRATELRRLVTAGHRPTLPKDMPECIANVIKACWEQDPARRPSFATVVEQLVAASEELQLTCFTDGTVTVGKKAAAAEVQVTGAKQAAISPHLSSVQGDRQTSTIAPGMDSDTEKPTLHAYPGPVLLQLLKTLDDDSLLAAFRSCRHLRDMVIQQAHTTKLQARLEDRLTIEGAISILTRASKLSSRISLSLEEPWAIKNPSEWEVLLSRMPAFGLTSSLLKSVAPHMGILDKLIKLELTGAFLDALLPEVVCPNLETLRLEKSRLNSALAHLRSTPPTVPKLHTLQLQDIGFKGDSDTLKQHLSQQLAQLPALNSLSLTTSWDNWVFLGETQRRKCGWVCDAILDAALPTVANQLASLELSWASDDYDCTKDMWGRADLGHSLMAVHSIDIGIIVTNAVMEGLLALPSLVHVTTLGGLNLTRPFYKEPCSWQSISCTRMGINDLAYLPLHADLLIKARPGYYLDFRAVPLHRGYVTRPKYSIGLGYLATVGVDVGMDVGMCRDLMSAAVANITRSGWPGWKHNRQPLKVDPFWPTDILQEQMWVQVLPLLSGASRMFIGEGEISSMGMQELSKFAAAQQQGFHLELHALCKWGPQDMLDLVPCMPDGSKITVSDISEGLLVKMCYSAQHRITMHVKVQDQFDSGLCERIKTALLSHGRPGALVTVADLGQKLDMHDRKQRWGWEVEL